MNGVASNMGETNCGVPQGSCLGPLLFFIYINDLPFSLKNSEVTMYADDTSISYSSKGGFRRRALLALYSTRINCNLDRPKRD